MAEVEKEKQRKLELQDTLNFVDPDQDPEEEVMIILEMVRKMDPDTHMESMKMKEETRDRLSGNGHFGLTFLFL